MNTEQLLAAARLAATLGGCTCDPDVDVETDTAGIHTAHVRHDAWCSLLKRRAARCN